MPTPANLGDVMKTSDMVIEKAYAKANTTITKGMAVCNDGSGFVPATAALAATYKVYIARENKPAADPDRAFMVLEKGVIVAQKTTGTAVVQGQKAAVSATTAGQLIAFAATNDLVGTCYKPAASTDTQLWIRL